MWKPEYAANRREKYQSDAAERERRKSQGRKDDGEYNREYYQRNKDKWNKRTPEQREAINRRRRERYASDAEYRELLKSQSRDVDPAVKRERHLRRFGITPEQYDHALELQDGGCAICRSPIGDSTGRRHHVDHNHSTGAVRGILCSECNLGLGKFQDDPIILGRAVQYLLDHA